MQAGQSRVSWQSNVKKPVFFILSVNVVLAAVNVIILTLLVIGQAGLKYEICPIVLLALCVLSSAITLIGKHKVKAILHSIVTAAVAAAFGAGLLIVFNSGGTVISAVALSLWIAAQAAYLSALAAAVVFEYINVNGKLFKLLSTSIIALLAAIYAAFIIMFGFFGQGASGRTIVYTYDYDRAGYVVSGVLEGRGKGVSIPESFNGKPVAGVSCSVFADDSLSEFIFESEVVFTNADKLAGVDVSGKKLFAEASVVDGIRAQLYNCADDETIRNNALTLADSVTAPNLPENQVCITFGYGYDDFKACQGKILPAYIGEKSAFDINSYAAEYGYVVYRDKTSVSHLDWAYTQGNGYILSEITCEDSSVTQGFVPSVSGVARVKFERVYRIYFDGGNDNMYDLTAVQPSECYDNLNGARLNYKYVTENGADELLSRIEPRKGFTLEWNYAPHNYGQASGLTSLTQALKEHNGDLDVYPVWTLEKPKVGISSSAADGCITYGENVSFTADVTYPVDWLCAEYIWKHNGQTVGNSSRLDLIKPSLSGAYDGVYTLEVSINGGNITSCSSFATAQTELVITPRKVTAKWSIPDKTELTYDGEAKRVEVVLDDKQGVAGDEPVYGIAVNGDMKNGSFTDLTDAGDYTLTAVFTGGSQSNYILDETEEIRLTILPCKVRVEWTGERKVYNGEEQKPTAQALGLDGLNVVSQVLGGGADAGEYEITATCGSGNYVLVNHTTEMVIEKAPLEIKPIKCVAVYGEVPKPNGAEFTGFVGGDDEGVLSGSLEFAFGNGKADVGLYAKSVSVSGVTAVNYEITFLKGDFEIVALEAELGWLGYENLIYNNSPKAVYAVVTNAVQGDDVSVVVSGGDGVMVGNYTARALSLIGKDSFNYTLAKAHTCAYAVSKAVIKVSANDKQKVYGEQDLPLDYSVHGTIYGDELEFALTREAGERVGEYAISIKTVKDNINYFVECAGAKLTVTPRKLSVIWSGTNGLVYNGAAHNITAEAVDVLAGDDAYVGVSGTDNFNAGKHKAQAILLGTDSGNYVLGEGEICEYEIAKADLPLSVYIEDTQYGDDYNPKYSGNLGRAEVSFYYGVTADDLYLKKYTAVGEYYVAACVEETENYKAARAISRYAIVPRTVTLTWNNYANLVYDSTPKNVTARVGNTVGNEDVKARVLGGDEVNAGAYTATAELYGEHASNYQLPQVYTLGYTVEKCKIDIYADNKNSVYLEQLNELTAHINGVIYNNEVNYTLVKEEGTDAGEYAIDVVVGEYANYEIRTYPAYYKILPRKPYIDKTSDGKYAVGVYVAYGTTLGELASLMPATEVSGSWDWADGAHTTVGSVGTKRFLVDFVPDDNRNYLVVRVTVELEVRKDLNYTIILGSLDEESCFEDASVPYTLKWNGESAVVDFAIASELNKKGYDLTKITVKRQDGHLALASIEQTSVTLFQTGVYYIKFECPEYGDYMSASVTVTVIVK